MPEPTTPAPPTCGCCTFGNHTEPWTCDGADCCHPQEHRGRAKLACDLGCDHGDPCADCRTDVPSSVGTPAASPNETGSGVGACEDGPFQVWPLARILREVAVGSKDWTWPEEWADLDRRHAETGYLIKLEQQIRANGITMPVLIGSDGRLWDGHHRLLIASRLGIGYVPVEIVKTTPGPASDGELAGDEARDAIAFVGEMCDTADREDAPVTTASVREWLKGPKPGHRVGFPPPPPSRDTMREAIAGVLAQTDGICGMDHGFTGSGIPGLGPEADAIIDAVLALRDGQLQQMRERLRKAERAVNLLAGSHRRAEEAVAKVAAAIALHQPVDGRTGWDGNGDYDDVSPACSACGSHDAAEPYPCATVTALTAPTGQGDGGGQ